MKFSIRDLLLVTVIVALGLGWWLEHRQLAALRTEHAKEVQRYEELRQTMNSPFRLRGDAFPLFLERSHGQSE